MTRPVWVVGIGADGWDGLSAEARLALSDTDVILGSARQLAMLEGTGAERVPWPSPLVPSLAGVLQRYADRKLCVLASGDPMFYGIGAAIARILGPDALRIVPHVSSVSLACARLGWAVEDVDVVSVVGRPIDAVRRWLSPGRRVLVLSEGASTPAAIGAVLREAGNGASRVRVLERLGAADERVVEGVAGTFDALNVVAIECAGGAALSVAPGLPDDAFEHDGQITKRDIRATVLARLAPKPGLLLWDVGAGAGSIAVEWMRAHPSCRAIAIESDAERAERIGSNARALGVPGLEVVHGLAPAALDGLDAPDAVFVGGGLTDDGVLQRCWDALRPQGVLVGHAVTLQSEDVLRAWHAAHGGDLVRISIERAEPLGRYTTWRPALPVTQWAATR